LLAYPWATQTSFAFLEATGIRIACTVGAFVWDESGRRFARYAERRRQSTQESPRRLLADFVIGVHALASADRLVTFDQNFYKQYFPELQLI